MPIYDCGDPECTECQRAFGPDRTKAIENYKRREAFYATLEPKPNEPTEPRNCEGPGMSRDDKIMEALRDIANAKEPPDNPYPDDIDWQFVALEMKRVANIALSTKATEPAMVTDAQFVAWMRRAAEIAQTRVTTSFDDCERGGADPSTGAYECSLDSRGRDCLCVEHQEEADAIARAILAEAALAAREATP